MPMWSPSLHTPCGVQTRNFTSLNKLKMWHLRLIPSVRTNPSPAAATREPVSSCIAGGTARPRPLSPRPLIPLRAARIAARPQPPHASTGASARR